MEFKRISIFNHIHFWTFPAIVPTDEPAPISCVAKQYSLRFRHNKQQVQPWHWFRMLRRATSRAHITCSAGNMLPRPLRSTLRHHISIDSNYQQNLNIHDLDSSPTSGKTNASSFENDHRCRSPCAAELMTQCMFHRLMTTHFPSFPLHTPRAMCVFVVYFPSPAHPHIHDEPEAADSASTAVVFKNPAQLWELSTLFSRSPLSKQIPLSRSPSHLCTHFHSWIRCTAKRE